MSARKVSREPYTVRREPREVWVAVAVAVAIVLVTAVVVWILAPGDSPTPAGTPAGTPTVSTPAPGAPTVTSGPEAVATPGDTTASGSG